MQPEARHRLKQVREAGETIIEITTGKSFGDYQADKVLRLAVERLFSIVGEALREAAKVEPTIASEVTAYRSIVDFRNVLVHDYAAIYDEGVWRIIVYHLPRLLDEIQALLSAEEE